MGFRRISWRCPQFEKGNLKLAASLPMSASQRTSCTFLNSSVMKFATSGLPMVSFLLPPSRLEALACHSVIAQRVDVEDGRVRRLDRPCEVVGDALGFCHHLL